MSHGARILVISDRAYQGRRRDASGPLLLQELARMGFDLGEDPVCIVPDSETEIEGALRAMVSDQAVRFVVTTGGTGIALRDVTPEATRRVMERELPGFGELMRSESRTRTALAPISRATAGTAGGTLIVNLPGSPKGAVECLGFVEEAARHVLDILAGDVSDCGSARDAEQP